MMLLTGLDILNIKIGLGSSTFGDDQNPDYYFNEPDGVNGSKQVDIIGTDNDSDIGFYFTGDVNLTGVKVDNDGTKTITPVVDGTTYYRWGNSPPDE